MLEAALHVDLPSRRVERPAPRWAGRGRAPEPPIEHLSVRATEVVEHLLAALVDGQLTDLLGLWVDGAPRYLDRTQRPADLEEAVLGSLQEGLVREGHRGVRLLVDHRDRDLHAVVDVELRSPVPLGQDPLTLRVSAEIGELRPVAGETALDWHRRVRAFARDPRRIEAYHVLHRVLVGRLAERVREGFGSVRADEPWVELTRPDAATLAAMARLPFGPAVTVARYTAPAGEPPPGDRPEDLFWPDPYRPLLHWYLIDALVTERTWARPWVRVVGANHLLLATGDQVAERPDRLAWRHDAVSYDVDGRLLVHASAL